MFCVIHRNEREICIVFETYAEMRDYVKGVYKPTRIKDGGSYKLENIGIKHLEPQRRDLIRAYRDNFECVCYDHAARKKLEKVFPNGTKNANIWRLEVLHGVVE